MARRFTSKGKVRNVGAVQEDPPRNADRYRRRHGERRDLEPPPQRGSAVLRNDAGRCGGGCRLGEPTEKQGPERRRAFQAMGLTSRFEESIVPPQARSIWSRAID